MSKKYGIIFDMDGTLWDSAEGVAKSWNEIIWQKGYNDIRLTETDIKSVMGKTMKDIADALFQFAGDDKYKLLDECEQNENRYLEEHGGMLYPYLEETFQKLIDRGYRLYIVSNCQKGYIEAFLNYYDFWKYIDDIECYGNNLKSKGENIALVTKRNNLDKAVYVGDIQSDYDSSVQADTPFIHAKYGFGMIDAEVPYINSLIELSDAVENVF